MGKQQDVLNLLQKTLRERSEIEAIDLDTYPENPNRLKVSLVPIKKRQIDTEIQKKLEDSVALVYSGKKQVSKLTEQRFTREDFPELAKMEKLRLACC